MKRTFAVKRRMGIKRTDERRMVELRVEGGVKESQKRKLVRSSLKRVVHVDRIGDKIKTGKSRCPESGWKREAMKNDIRMG